MSVSPATLLLEIAEPFVFYRGGEVAPLTLAYETWGRLAPNRDNAVLVFTGLSPGAHAAASPADPQPGWWEGMIGPGRAIDTGRWFVVCVNSLGSCKGSTGPASPHPADGRPWRLRFPELAIEDIAAATRRVTDHLGIEQLDTLVGPSMGGMSALAWLRLYPGRARRLISLSSAQAASPWAIAIRSLQREAIVGDPQWRNGDYDPAGGPIHGMRLARKLGMISYRSAAEWQARFGRQVQDVYPPGLFGMHYAVESYLEKHARTFAADFDPACYLYLSRAMDHFEAAEGQPSLAAMFAASGLEAALVMGAASDSLFPLWQQRDIAAALDAAGIPSRFVETPSLQGHDAFLLDFEHFAPPIAEFLQ